MKQNTSEVVIDVRKLLILSDGKPGHVNQSLAYADICSCEYSVVEVRFRNRFCKALSFLLDKVGIYTELLFKVTGAVDTCAAVVSAGSETYYPNRTLAARLGARSVAAMLPSGYRLGGFYQVIAQTHDRPPVRDNVTSLPINLCYVQPRNFFQPKGQERYIGMILGGPNKVMRMDPEQLRKQIERIFSLFPQSKFVVATSRRTPPEVDEILSRYDFTEAWIYSKDPVNPIPDFLAHCDHVFITADSTSMISEAVSYGQAAVEILPLIESGTKSKFNLLVEELERRGCLHLFDGSVENCRNKIDLAAELREVIK